MNGQLIGWNEKNFTWVFYFYVFFLTLSTYFIFVHLAIVYSFYYKSLFGKINKSIESLYQQPNYLVLNTKLLRLINEHNYLSNEIAKLNLFVRKSLATHFIAWVMLVHLFAYLVIKSHKFIYKFAWSVVSFGHFIIVFGLSYLFPLTSISAHQSYDKIFSILIDRKINFRVRLKVTSILIKSYWLFLILS